MISFNSISPLKQLNSIIAFNGLLLEGQLESQQKDFVSSALTSAEALLSVINNVLQYAKFESSGEISLENNQFDLCQLVDDLVDIVSPKVNKKNIEFNFNSDPQVPQFLVGDSFRLREVLINLIDNSIKFTSVIPFPFPHLLISDFILKDWRSELEN